jgi:hypothetical protein
VAVVQYTFTHKQYTEQHNEAEYFEISLLGVLQYTCQYKMFKGKHEGKRPLGRSRSRWEDIKMDLQAVGRGGMDWIDLAQDMDRWPAVVNVVMNLRVP